MNFIPFRNISTRLSRAITESDVSWNAIYSCEARLFRTTYMTIWEYKFLSHGSVVGENVI